MNQFVFLFVGKLFKLFFLNAKVMTTYVYFNFFGFKLFIFLRKLDSNCIKRHCSSLTLKRIASAIVIVMLFIKSYLRPYPVIGDKVLIANNKVLCLLKQRQELLSVVKVPSLCHLNLLVYYLSFQVKLLSLLSEFINLLVQLRLPFIIFSLSLILSKLFLSLFKLMFMQGKFVKECLFAVVFYFIHKLTSWQHLSAELARNWHKLAIVLIMMQDCLEIGARLILWTFLKNTSKVVLGRALFLHVLNKITS